MKKLIGKISVTCMVILTVFTSILVAAVPVKVNAATNATIAYIETNEGDKITNDNNGVVKQLNIYRHQCISFNAVLNPVVSNEVVSYRIANPKILSQVRPQSNTAAIFMGLLEGTTTVTATTASGNSFSFNVKVQNIIDINEGSTFDKPENLYTKDKVENSNKEVFNYYRSGTVYSNSQNKLSYSADIDYFGFRILSNSTMTVKLTMDKAVDYIPSVTPSVMYLEKKCDKNLPYTTSLPVYNSDGTKTVAYTFRTKHYVNFLDKNLEVSDYIISVASSQLNNVSNKPYTISVSYNYSGNVSVANGGMWYTGAIDNAETGSTNINSATGINAVYAKNYSFESGDITTQNNFNKAYNYSWYLTETQATQWRKICNFIYSDAVMANTKEYIDGEGDAILNNAFLSAYTSKIQDGDPLGLKKYKGKVGQFVSDYLYQYMVDGAANLPDIVASLCEETIVRCYSSNPLLFINLIEEYIDREAKEGNVSEALSLISQAIDINGSQIEISGSIREFILTGFRFNELRSKLLGCVKNTLCDVIGKLGGPYGDAISLLGGVVVDSMSYGLKYKNYSEWKKGVNQIKQEINSGFYFNKPIVINALTANYIAHGRLSTHHFPFSCETWNGTSIPMTQRNDLVGNVKAFNSSSKYLIKYTSSIQSLSTEVSTNKPVVINRTRSIKDTSTISINGFSMNSEGINKYFYTIDDRDGKQVLLSASLNNQLLNQYSEYKGSCSDINTFTGYISVSSLKPGSHKIYLFGYTKQGSTYEIGVINLIIDSQTKGQYVNALERLENTDSITASNKEITTSYSRIRNTVLSIPVKGWSVNTRGVSEFYYVFDDMNDCGGTKLTGCYREDVAKSYPSYNVSTSDICGFSGMISVGNLAPGSHSIYIKAKDKDENHYVVAKITVNITTTPNKGSYINKLNSPSSSSVVKNGALNISVSRAYKSTSLVNIDGWSVNSQGVSKYYYSIDNEGSTNTSLSLKESFKQDVYDRYLYYQYPCINKNSFTGAINVSKLLPGEHYIYVKAMNKEGYHYTIGKIKVNITTQYKNKIDTIPSEVTTNKMTEAKITRGYHSTLPVKIGGWSLHNDGIKSFYYTIDSVNSTSGTNLSSCYRSDVSKAYPEFDKYCPSINGFNGEINVSNITFGAHSIYVKGITNTGVHYVVAKITLTIETPKLGSYINTVDTPRGATVSNNIAEVNTIRTYGSSTPVEISGWSVNSQGISKYYYVWNDSKLTSGVSLKESHRIDVEKVHMAYKDACYDKNAYSGSVSVGNLAPGVHTLYVKALNKEGYNYVVGKVNITIASGGTDNSYLDGYGVGGSHGSAKATVDVSVERNNEINLNGWSVHSSGISSYYYSVDNIGATSGTSLQGAYRKDVDDANLAYGQMCKNLNSFTGKYNTRYLSLGTHYLYIKAKTKDNKYYVVGTIVINVKPKIVGSYVNYLDSPVKSDGSPARVTITQNYQSNDLIKVSGWSVNSQGISSYFYSIDNSKAESGTPLTASYRIDVANANPSYSKACYDKNAFCGYVNTSGLSIGGHTIYVKARNKDGCLYMVAVINVNITVLTTIGERHCNIDICDGVTFRKTEDNDFAKISIGLNYGYGSTYTFNGWSVNEYGVENFYTTIDGNNLTYISDTRIRDDVKAAYPGFKVGNCNAYYGKVNLSNLSRGIHYLRIYATNGTGYQYLVSIISVNVH